MLITISDVRKAGYCVSGARRWWPAQSYEMSFADFLKTGMDSEDFLAGGDELAAITVQKKVERDG